MSTLKNAAAVLTAALALAGTAASAQVIAAPVPARAAARLDPLPPILHPYRAVMPGAPDEAAIRRENMIVAKLDLQRLDGYLAALAELQAKDPSEGRAKQIETYRGYRERVQEALERSEAGVPEGQRAADVQETYSFDADGNLTVTRTVTFGDGTSETTERTIPAEPR
ncbi:MAG: hypothetical protein HYZ75_07160 [Elusimicrobia bacterium]|nr:hypothetical protein [Elusimicrobiota bacterium]